VLAVVLATAHVTPILWLPLGVALFAGVVFGSLTTEVDQAQFSFWFGPGAFRRSIALAEVHTCTVVQNPWWYGWGIHLTPRGWLYNVAGRDAIELTLRDGRTLRVGSDEAHTLCATILQLRGRAP